MQSNENDTTGTCYVPRPLGCSLGTKPDPVQRGLRGNEGIHTACKRWREDMLRIGGWNSTLKTVVFWNMTQWNW